MPGSIAVIARAGGPVAAVQRAQRRAAIVEIEFQLARLEAIDLGREPPKQRELARNWIQALRRQLVADRQARDNE